MSWKFKRYKIRWQRPLKKFRLIKKNRQKAFKMHYNYIKNKTKIKTALRKSKIKRRITMKKNKAQGIYNKLKIARKRWKNLLKSDVNLYDFMTNILYEEKQQQITIDIGVNDLTNLINLINDIKIYLDINNNNFYYDPENMENYYNIYDFLDNAQQQLYVAVNTLEVNDYTDEIINDLLNFIDNYIQFVD